MYRPHCDCDACHTSVVHAIAAVFAGKEVGLSERVVLVRKYPLVQTISSFQTLQWSSSRYIVVVVKCNTQSLSGFQHHWYTM